MGTPILYFLSDLVLQPRQAGHPRIQHRFGEVLEEIFNCNFAPEGRSQLVIYYCCISNNKKRRTEALAVSSCMMFNQDYEFHDGYLNSEISFRLFLLEVIALTGRIFKLW